MRVLVACEESGVVREAFRRRGHDATSCDLLPSALPGPHVQGDVRPLLRERWDLVLAFPPCTYLCLSGIHWNNRIPGRRELTEQAVTFFRAFTEADSPRIAIENPRGVMSRYWRKADQTIQPWQFGHPESKQTDLWLVGLPLLVPTNVLTPTRFQVNGKPRWDNMTATGQNKLGPSPTRARDRARTYPGIAEAMADQWGTL